MDKNFLGLGITFNAIDNGLAKTAGKISGALGQTKNAIGDVDKTTRGGKFMQGLQDGLRNLTIAKVANDLSGLKDKLSGSHSGFNDAAVQIDTMRAKLGAALNPKVASAFTGQLMGVMHHFGLTGDQAEIVAQNMTNAGVSLTEMQKTLPMVGSLVGVLGMDAGKVSEMFGTAMGTLKMSSTEAVGLSKEIFKIQKDYQLTDLMTPLPEIIDNVYKNSIRFGKVNSKQSMAAVIDITKMSAAFQKVGFSQQQAIHMATGWNDKMGDIKESILDIQAGLEPSSSSLHDLQEALASELNPDTIMGLITGGGDMSEVMKEIQKEMAGLNDQQQMVLTQRLKRVFGPELTAMLNPLASSMDAVDAAAKKNDKTLGSASVEYGKLEGALKNTLAWQKKMTTAAEEFNEITKVLKNKGDYIDSLQKQRDVWDKLTDAVNDSNSSLGAFQLLAQGLKDLGLGFLFPSATTAGTFAGALSGMLIPLTSILGIFQIFKQPLSWILSAFKGLGRLLISPFKSFGTVLSWAGNLLTKLSGPFEALFAEAEVGVSIFARLGAFFGDLVALVNPITWAILAVSAAFIGLYAYWTPFTKSVDGFIDSFSFAFLQMADLVHDLFTDFSGTFSHIGERFKGIGGSLVEGWQKWTSMLVPIWDEQVEKFVAGWHVFTGFFSSAAKSLGKGWDNLVYGLGLGWDGFTGLFTRAGKALARGWSSVVGGIGDAFMGMAKAIGKGWNGVLSGISGAWNGATSFIKDTFTAAFNYISDKLAKFGDFFSNIGSNLTSAWTSITSMLSGGLDAAWNTLLSKGMGAVKSLVDTFSSVKEKISSVFAGMSELFKDPFATLGSAFESAKTTIASGMKNLFGGIFDSLPDFILAFLKGGGPIGALMQGGSGLVKGFKSLFGDSSPAPNAAPSMAMAATVPSQFVAAPMGGASNSVGTAPTAQPTNYQPTAPTMSPMAGADLKPTVVPQLKDANFQAVAQGLADMKDTLAALLSQLINKPVNVVLQGDARGMLRSSSRQAASDAGAMGHNAALSP